MKRRDLWVIYNRTADTFLRCSPRHYFEVSDIQMANVYGPNGALARIERMGERRHLFEPIPAPQCGCCGALPFLSKVAQFGYEPEGAVWRCEKHVGRIPCLIDGCGRTFPGTKYASEYLCSTHWREVPAKFRKAIKRIEAQGRRRGWSPVLLLRHGRLWSRIVRSITEGRHLDMDEVNRMFGWES